MEMFLHNSRFYSHFFFRFVTASADGSRGHAESWDYCDLRIKMIQYFFYVSVGRDMKFNWRLMAVHEHCDWFEIRRAILFVCFFLFLIFDF